MTTLRLALVVLLLSGPAHADTIIACGIAGPWNCLRDGEPPPASDDWNARLDTNRGPPPPIIQPPAGYRGSTGQWILEGMHKP
jgi:hypothetical protein